MTPLERGIRNGLILAAPFWLAFGLLIAWWLK